METTHIWSRERFPVVMEQDRPTAVLVDVESFAEIELILNNLLNRNGEAEDDILVASGLLERLVSRAKTTSPSSNWQKVLDEL